MELQLHTFLTLTLGTGEWSASRRDHFTARENPLAPVKWDAGVGRLAGQGVLQKRSFLLLPGYEPRIAYLVV